MLERRPLVWVLPVTLACFAMAGATGVLYRYGLVFGFPFEFEPHRVRHAHSHLMYFSWVTPLLMALIATTLLKWGREVVVGAGRACFAAILLGLLAYAPFLLYGYELAPVGGRELPLSMMAAGLNVVPWYLFTAWYARARKDVVPSPARVLFDGAVTFLVLASLGAWALAALSVSGAGSSFLETSALHIFLDYFAEGWLVLGVLGLIHARLRTSSTRATRLGTALLLIGLPFVFLLAIPRSMVPPALVVIASIGGLCIAGGTLLHVHALRSAGHGWRIVLVLLAVKSLGTALYAVPGIGEWLMLQGLRLLYLHVLLLGVVTLGLMRAAGAAWFNDRLPGFRYMTVGVMVMLASLLPLTRLWPGAWGGYWVHIAALLAAAGVVLVSIVILHLIARRLWAGAPPRLKRRRRAAQAA